MGKIKQNTIIDPYDIGPFTQTEVDRFEWEEEQMNNDIKEMQDTANTNRDNALKELEIVLTNLKSWEETRKFSSSLIDDSRERVGSVIDMMRDGKLWGPNLGPYVQ